jgi:hypothetical protein
MRNIFRRITKRDYDATNLDQHKGMTYTTTGGSDYSIDRIGYFHGRDSIEWTIPEAIAGIDPSKIKKVEEFFGSDDRNGLYNFVKTDGEKPSAGKHLVVVLSATDAKLKKRIGLKSSPLEGLL